MNTWTEKHDITVTTTRECSRCGDFITSNVHLEGWTLADINSDLEYEISNQFEHDGCKHGQCAECTIATAKDDAAAHDADEHIERVKCGG